MSNLHLLMRLRGRPLCMENNLEARSLLWLRSRRLIRSMSGLVQCKHLRPPNIGAVTNFSSRYEGREVYIRNIDFRAHDNDVQELFQKYGRIEKVRLPPGPKKGTHKGYGFVTFSTKVSQKVLFHYANLTAVTGGSPRSSRRREQYPAQIPNTHN